MNLENIDSELTNEYSKLESYAEALLEEYWDERKANMQDSTNSERTAVIGCRFKGKGKNLRIVWYHNKFRGPKGKRKTFSTEFKKPHSTTKYDLKDFKSVGAPKWEVELAIETEKELAKLRDRKKELDGISRAITSYLKNADSMGI